MTGSRNRATPADSPLRHDIGHALKLRGKRAAALRVSISRAEWFTPPGTDEKVRVKWFCWRLVSKNGHNVTKPKYGVLHGGLANRVLHRSLREWFPDIPSYVHNKIELS